MGYTFIIDFFLQLVQPLFPYTFDPLLAPLLGVGGPLTGARLTIVVISIGLGALLTGLRYVLIDMEQYEALKEKREEMNKRMKEAQEDGNVNPGEHMEEMMDNFIQMQKVMIKPLIVSSIMFFLILPWMYATFIPIVNVSQTGDGQWSGTLDYNGVSMPLDVTENSEPVVVVDGEQYTEGDMFKTDGLPWKVKNIDTENGEVKLAAVIVQSPVPILWAGNELSWLGTYILVMIPVSFAFQRWLGLH